MTKLLISPDETGYSVTENTNSLLSAALAGGRPRTRLDVLGATRLVSVQWSGGKTRWQTVRDFLKQNVANNCPLFELDLIIDTADYQEYECNVIPGSIKSNNRAGIGYSISATLQVRPLANILPLLALHLDGDYTDLSGHTIGPFDWVFGIIPPTFSPTGAKFDQSLVTSYITQPLISDNRGHLTLNQYGEWQISVFVKPTLGAIIGGGAIIGLMGGNANGTTLNGDPTTGQIFVDTQGGDGHTVTELRVNYIGDVAGVPTACTLHDIVTGSPIYIPYDVWTHIGIVGDETSTRAYIGGVLAKDDHIDGARPAGSAPMLRTTDYVDQFFTVSSSFAGGAITVFPSGSVWTNTWSGELDDLKVTNGLKSATFKGPTIDVPTSPFSLVTWPIV